MVSTIMEKLLWPALSSAYGEHGATHVGGPVVRAADTADLGGPAALVEAHGLGGVWPGGPRPDHVDVLRYRPHPLMRHDTPPTDPSPRPWPTFPHGFLPTRGAVVPVWLLRTTRVPVGSEVWRVWAGGDQRPLLAYGGPAHGWRGTQAWAPPLGFVGARAEWQGREWIAAHAADPAWIQLVAYGDAAPAGFELARPGVVTRTVPVSECSRVFALDLRGTWGGMAVRMLARNGEQAHVELLDPDPRQAGAVGRMVEPGRFELTVAAEQVVGAQSTVDEV